MSSSKKNAASSSSIAGQDASQNENAVISEKSTSDTSALQDSASQADTLQSGASDSAKSQVSPVDAQSLQPIPPPSEPRQFRAIGLLQGVYVPSEEQFNRGELVTREGLRLDAVLLGQVMSLVKKYLDLSLPHLWVVYPRTRDAEPMHVQLVGVWSPEGFGETDDTDLESDSNNSILQSLSPLESLKPPLKDGFFSIRGQVIQQDPENHTLFVKIQQTSRKKNKSAKAFKLKLMGDIAQKPMGYFWDFEVVREGDVLQIEKATPISFMPLKKKKKAGPPRRPSKGGAPSHKPIKKSVPLGQEPGKTESKAPPSVVKRKAPTPSRPLPKIIKPQDSE